jgi:hypothetical protein
MLREFKSTLLWLPAATSVSLVPMCLVLLLDLHPGTTYTDHLSSAVHLLAAALFLTLRPAPPSKTALPEEHQDLFRYALRSGVLPIGSLFSDWSHELAHGARAQILALRVLPAGTGLAILLDVYGLHLDPTGRLFFLSCAAATTAFAAAAFTLSAVRLRNISVIEAKLDHQIRLLKESHWPA